MLAAGRHRPEHDRGAGADRDAGALRAASLARRTRRAGGDPRHRRAARLRPAHPRRRPHLPVQHRRPEAHPRADAGATGCKHVAPAEAIVEQEAQTLPERLGAAPQRPGHRPADAGLRGRSGRRSCASCSAKLNGQLTDADRKLHRGGVPAVAEPVPARADQRPDRGDAASGTAAATRCWRRCGSCSGWGSRIRLRGARLVWYSHVRSRSLRR